MPQNDLPKMQALFKNSKFIELTTINLEGYPETRAMLNLANKDICPHLQNYYEAKDNMLKEIWFTTNLSSMKTKQIVANPKAAVYFFIPEGFGGVLLIGEAQIITEQKIRDMFWHDTWKMYYSKGSTDEDYAIIKFIAQNYKFYDGNLAVTQGNL